LSSQLPPFLLSFISLCPSCLCGSIYFKSSGSMRIVSLLPSATEMVCRLGLAERLVGVTHECDFPATVVGLPVGATSREIDQLVREHLATQRALYALDRPVLERLRPDLIVTQGLCDVCAVAEDEVRAVAAELPSRPRVVNLQPQTLDGVLDAIEQLGTAAGVDEAARRVRAELESRIEAVARRSATIVARPRTVLLEWIDPPFSAGHWSPELVRLAGGREMLGREGEPSRRVVWDEVVAADPEVLVLACCGYALDQALGDVPTLRSQPDWAELACVRSRRVFAVDGSAYFNRPGPRLVDSLEIVAHAIAPNVHPPPVEADHAHQVL
jgi:iron complex transport system substrate-binding protein